MNGETEKALGKLLQFVRDFSADQRNHERRAIANCGTLRRIAISETKGLSFKEAEAERRPAIDDILRLLDEIELNPRPASPREVM